MNFKSFVYMGTLVVCTGIAIVASPIAGLATIATLTTATVIATLSNKSLDKQEEAEGGVSEESTKIRTVVAKAIMTLTTIAVGIITIVAAPAFAPIVVLAVLLSLLFTP